jgi:putative membrane protein
MMHWNLGWGEMMIGGLGMLALWALLVGLVFWGISSFAGGDRSSSSQVSGARPTPLEILQGRYASGEVGREEYEAIRRDLNSA